MSLLEIVERRKRALIRSLDQATGMPPLVQVGCEADFAIMGAYGSRDPAERTEPVGNRQLGSCFLRIRPGDPDRFASLWVRSSYTGYKDAWFDFIRQVYGVDAGPADLPGHDIDHLLSRARGVRTAYLRVEAIPSSANRSWGAGIEGAAATTRNSARKNAMPWRYFSNLIAAKLAGLPQPGAGAPARGSGIAAASALLQRYGLPRHLADQAMTHMVEHIYRNRA